MLLPSARATVSGRSLVGFSPFCLAREPTRRTREKAAMPATTTPLRGDPLLAGVTDAMVALHQHYHHARR